MAPESDFHAAIVAERVRERGHTATLFNTTWFPWPGHFSWTPESSLTGHGMGEERLCLQLVDRVWWRRFKKPTLHPSVTDDNVKDFCDKEALYMMRSPFIQGDGFVVNCPISEFRAAHKPYQLQSASRLGLNVPKTLISNDAVAIQEFIKTQRRVIYKTLICSFPHSVATRELKGSLFDSFSIEELSFAPMIFQELVEAKLDIRVTTVGNQVFAGQLQRVEINDAIDWRMKTAEWKIHTLPVDVSEGLVRLTKEMGLIMSSHDLRLGLDGKYYFIETNPNGQFLFLEIDAGLNITEAVADLLIS